MEGGAQRDRQTDRETEVERDTYREFYNSREHVPSTGYTFFRISCQHLHCRRFFKKYFLSLFRQSKSHYVRRILIT